MNLHLAALEDAGLLGITEEDGRASVYLADRVDDLPVAGLWEPVPHEDWNETWKAGLDPVRVGALVVTPPWHATGAAEEIVIDPGQAFGTGHHETTAGCLAALQDHPVRSRHVCDVGAGSGVLAVAAARLGAASVVALDTDPLAVQATAANAAANGVHVVARQGSVPDVDGPFDVVLANLDTATVVGLAAELAAAVLPAGVLIVSGVSLERAGEACRALQAARLTPAVRRGTDWAVLVARHR